MSFTIDRADFVGKLNDDGVQDGITLQEIAKFRQGDYKDAEPEVKRKWCHVMLHFLPCVCVGYQKADIKRSTSISEVSHATDEALVLWFLQCYVADWDEMYEKSMQNQEPEIKRRRKEGKHKSTEKISAYIQLHARVKAARKGVEAKGWDDAVMDEALLQEDRQHNRVLADSMPNAALANVVAKETNVLEFTDDEEAELPKNAPEVVVHPV